MSKKALLDANDASRRLTIYHEEDNQTFIESRQDCDHIVRAAKILSDHAPTDPSFKLVGFVPEAVLNQWLIDGSFSDPSTLKRWLNDPDHRDFRVGNTRL